VQKVLEALGSDLSCSLSCVIYVNISKCKHFNHKSYSRKEVCIDVNNDDDKNDDDNSNNNNNDDDDEAVHNDFKSYDDASITKLCHRIIKNIVVRYRTTCNNDDGNRRDHCHTLHRDYSLISHDDDNDDDACDSMDDENGGGIVGDQYMEVLVMIVW